MTFWLRTCLRFYTDLWYWNGRKTWFVLRGRRGACPCQDPSDSGVVGATGCEGAAGWPHPAGFKNVCPLLVRSPQGRWVCGVGAAQVRPFWGRAFGWFAGLGLSLVLVGGSVVWGTMRTIGYPVTITQVFWPPDWSDFSRLQARLFADRARQQLALGHTREAVAALTEAGRLDPDNYEVNFTLARLTQVTEPHRAWQIYQRLLVVQPAHHDETAQAAGRALLLSGRWDDLAGLARQELVRGAAGESGWLQALVSAARIRQHPEWVRQTAAACPRAATRVTLEFLGRVVGAPGSVERYQVLTSGRPPLLTPYLHVFCADELIRLNRSEEALALVSDPAAGLGGRDVARLMLAAHAQAGDRAWVRLQFAALLRGDRQLRAAEVELLALHLLRWPDPECLALLVANHPRIQADPPAARLAAEVTLYCATRLQGNENQQTAVRLSLLNGLGSLSGIVDRLDQGHVEEFSKQIDVNALSEFPTVPIELLYFLRDGSM